jgi:hypothetical protein
MGRVLYFICITGVVLQKHTHYLYISNIVSGSWIFALHTQSGIYSRHYSTYI